MMQRSLVGALLCGALHMAGTGSVQAESGQDSLEPLCYWPCEVVVHGVLEEQYRYGPPNFGETPKEDVLLQVYYIRFDVPLNIRDGGEHGEAMSGVPGVQVELHPKPVEADYLVGKRVIATGTLLQGITPNHFEPVVLTLRTPMSLVAEGP